MIKLLYHAVPFIADMYIIYAAWRVNPAATNTETILEKPLWWPMRWSVIESLLIYILPIPQVKFDNIAQMI